MGFLAVHILLKNDLRDQTWGGAVTQIILLCKEEQYFWRLKHLGQVMLHLQPQPVFGTKQSIKEMDTIRPQRSRGNSERYSHILLNLSLNTGKVYVVFEYIF